MGAPLHWLRYQRKFKDALGVASALAPRCTPTGGTETVYGPDSFLLICNNVPRLCNCTFGSLCGAFRPVGIGSVGQRRWSLASGTAYDSGIRGWIEMDLDSGPGSVAGQWLAKRWHLECGGYYGSTKTIDAGPCGIQSCGCDLRKLGTGAMAICSGPVLSLNGAMELFPGRPATWPNVQVSWTAFAGPPLLACDLPAESASFSWDTITRSCGIATAAEMLPTAGGARLTPGGTRANLSIQIAGPTISISLSLRNIGGGLCVTEASGSIRVCQNWSTGNPGAILLPLVGSRDSQTAAGVATITL